VLTKLLARLLGVVGLIALPKLVFASSAAAGTSSSMGQTGSGWGMLALPIFVGAYLFVMLEEFIHLRKSKPVILAAGIISEAWRVYNLHSIRTISK
jgi:hypothetical protein